MLAVAHDALVVLAAFEFRHHHFLAAALGRDDALDEAVLDQRCTERDVRPVADHQYLLELHGIAFLCIQALHAHTLALAGAILLATRSKHRVHVGELLPTRAGCGS